MPSLQQLRTRLCGLFEMCAQAMPATPQSDRTQRPRCLARDWLPILLAASCTPALGISFCIRCGGGRPAGAHHCSTCDRCVLGFDHHCVYFNNCIGKLNYPFFIRTLFWTAVACAYGILFSSSHLLWCASHRAATPSRARAVR